jgi:hypothetical protein
LDAAEFGAAYFRHNRALRGAVARHQYLRFSGVMQKRLSVLGSEDGREND